MTSRRGLYSLVCGSPFAVLSGGRAGGEHLRPCVSRYKGASCSERRARPSRRRTVGVDFRRRWGALDEPAGSCDSEGVGRACPARFPSRQLSSSHIRGQGCAVTARLLDAREVAELLNVPVPWLRESRSGAIPCVPLGRM